MLETGDIDLLGGIQRTPAREKQFRFAELESFLNYNVLLARANDPRFQDKNLDELGTLNVGALNGRYETVLFRKYARRYHIRYRLHTYDSPADMQRAMENGDIDILLSSSISKINGMRILATFAPSPLFYAVRKDNKKLLDELDMAQSILKSHDPFFDFRLYEKHYGFNETNLPTLTRAERDALKNTPVLRIGCIEGWRPFSYSGHEGIVTDMLSYIASHTSLDIRYIDLPSHEAAYQKLQDGEIDAVGFAETDSSIITLRNLQPTTPFLQVPVVRVASGRQRRLDPDRPRRPHPLRQRPPARRTAQAAPQHRHRVQGFAAPDIRCAHRRRNRRRLRQRLQRQRAHVMAGILLAGAERIRTAYRGIFRRVLPGHRHANHQRVQQIHPPAAQLQAARIHHHAHRAATQAQPVHPHPRTARARLLRIRLYPHSDRRILHQSHHHPQPRPQADHRPALFRPAHRPAQPRAILAGRDTPAPAPGIRHAIQPRLYQYQQLQIHQRYPRLQQRQRPVAHRRRTAQDLRPPRTGRNGLPPVRRPLHPLAGRRRTKPHCGNASAS